MVILYIASLRQRLLDKLCVQDVLLCTIKLLVVCSDNQATIHTCTAIQGNQIVVDWWWWYGDTHWITVGPDVNLQYVPSLEAYHCHVNVCIYMISIAMLILIIYNSALPIFVPMVLLFSNDDLNY